MEEGIWFEGGESNACGGLIQASHVFIWPKQAYLIIFVLIGFHALEAFKRVMEDAGSGVKTEVLIRSYSGWEPSVQGGPFYR